MNYAIPVLGNTLEKTTTTGDFNTYQVNVDGTTITTDSNGRISAAKIPNALTIGNMTFDGSAAISVTAGNGIEFDPASGTPTTVAINAKAKSSGYLTVIEDGININPSKVDSDYTSSTSTDLATVATVTAAIGSLDVTEFALASKSGKAITIKGIKEDNGKIAIGTTAANDITFANVASTGKAEDISIDDNGGLITATTVEGALQEIAGKANGALQSISRGTDGSYVTTTIGEEDANHNQTVGVSVTVQAVSSAGASNMGLAEASDVKTYIDNKTADLSGAMHFRSVIDSNNSTVVAEINSYYGTQGSPAPKVGDVFVDTKTGKEYVVKTLTSGQTTIGDSNIEEFGSVNPQTTVASVKASTTTEGFAVTPTTDTNGAVTVTVNTENGYQIPTTTQMSKVDSIAVDTTAKSVTVGTNSLTNLVSDSNYKHITVTSTSVSDGSTTFNKYVHPTTTAAEAAAVKVGKDGEGHVVLGAHLASTDINLTSGDPAYDSSTTKTVSDSLKSLSTQITNNTPGVLSTSESSQSEVDVGERMNSDITLHKVAKTGKIEDLNQVDQIIFNCGSASVNTSPILS